MEHRSTRPGTTASLLALGLTAAMASFSCQAQNSEDEPGDESHWGLGVGTTLLQRPHRDIDDEVKVFPVVSYENRWVSLAGSRFDLKVNESERLSFRARARYSLDGYESDDSEFLRGMQDRDDSVWLGGALVWRLPAAELSAEYLADAMGNSKGSRAHVQAEHRFGFGRFGLTPRIAAEWVDKKYVAYYYGVQPDEATLVRPAYAGKSTINVEGGVRADYTFGLKHTVFLDIGVTGYGSAIKDSPIVDGSNQSRTSLGYVYRF